MIPDILNSVQDSDIESIVTSIFLGIDVELREMEDYHRTNKSNNGSKKTVVRITIRRYWKQALLNQNCLVKNNYSKHWLGNKKIRFFTNVHSH